MKPYPRDELLDAFLQDIAPLSDDEKAASLLTWFSAIIETMDSATLTAFRAHCLARFPASPEQNDILMQIDAQLALLGMERRESN